MLKFDRQFRALCVLLSIPVTALIVLAADPQPAPTVRSDVARAAIDKATAKENQADAVYRKAMIAAKRTEITELKTAQKSILADGDIDDATAVAAIIKQLEVDIVALAPTSTNTAQVTVDARQVVIVQLDKGVYKLKATGSWQNKPGGTMYGPVGTLGIRLGTDKAWLDHAVRNQNWSPGELIYSDDMTISLNASTFVSLRMMDFNPSDNSGSVTVVFSKLQ
jgi:hypothetical protein